MYTYHTLLQLSQVLAQHGVKQAVLSPGSRVAPLAISFARNPRLQTFTHSDERAAAYMALGLAQQSQKPIALACTSGTATLNYAPAIAEAFYQQVPLIVCTADRPPEWIDQQDGQAIRQQNIYGRHVKGSFQLPTDYSHPNAQWHALRIVNEAALLAQEYPQGPVHINIPIREPFYPDPEEVYFEEKPLFWEEEKGEQRLSPKQLEKLKAQIPASGKVLIVGGQGQKRHRLLSQKLPKELPVAADIISNLHGAPTRILHQDAWLGHLTPKQAEALKPDLLITFGQSVISKNLKLYLRKHRPQQHWHLQEAGAVADPFQSITKIIRMSPEVFWESMGNTEAWASLGTDYRDQWLGFDRAAQNFHLGGIKEGWRELKAVQQALLGLGKGWQVHLANSMAVRYANFFNLSPKQGQVMVWGNRGTSGIDGCTSSMLGHALNAPEQKHLLITGDVAFFYDRNALWHNYSMENMRILLLNNRGGGIFRMIKGPRVQAELEEYFVTQQASNAALTAQQARWAHRSIHPGKALSPAIDWLLEGAPGPRILEAFSDNAQAQKDMEAYRESMKRWIE